MEINCCLKIVVSSRCYNFPNKLFLNVSDHEQWRWTHRFLMRDSAGLSLISAGPSTSDCEDRELLSSSSLQRNKQALITLWIKFKHAKDKTNAAPAAARAHRNAQHLGFDQPPPLFDGGANCLQKEAWTPLLVQYFPTNIVQHIGFSQLNNTTQIFPGIKDET